MEAILEKSTLRVLIVDDYEPFRQFIATKLQTNPQLRIMKEACDGAEAVQQAQELQPDLILLDIGLPTLNGIEAARRIRKVSPTSKILFVTENRSTDIAEEALSTGAEWLCRQVGCWKRTFACYRSSSSRKAVCQRRFEGSQFNRHCRPRSARESRCTFTVPKR